MDASTARVVDWLRRHTGPNAPALFSISREDAQRLVALIDGQPVRETEWLPPTYAPDERRPPRWGYDPSGELWPPGRYRK